MIPRIERISVWMLVLAIALAVSMAIAAPPAGAAGASPAASPSASASLGGLAPLPNDQKVPAKWLPPGAFDPDTGPSDVIYPPQQITVRFNHKFHIAQGTACKTCHAAAFTSASAEDRLTPAPTVCDNCHMSEHANLSKVEPGDDEPGKCAFCHVGYKAGDGNMVARMNLPRANMIFNHQKHAARNINCQQCHGAVEELELATRDQLPRMRGCFKCHAMSDSAARGSATSACETCHVRALGNLAGVKGGRIKTTFASGQLFPPRWLHNAAHTPDFIDRHKMVAGNDSGFCASCHKEDFCTDCHDGRVRPRSIHPNDFLNMHAVEARLATQKCTSCHQEQSFCVGCHQRVGVSMTGPPGARNSGRFHPPKDVWSDPPRKPGHHAMEAQRNLNVCVSCHVERDCVQCHGAQGVGGGFNPHRSGFVGGCATQMRRNPRPCFTCHLPDDAVLESCR